MPPTGGCARTGGGSPARACSTAPRQSCGVYIDQHHVPRSLEPTLLLEARPVTRRRVRFSLAIAALIIANKFPSVWTVAFVNDRGNLRADKVIE
jgi:hypothetical protein